MARLLRPPCRGMGKETGHRKSALEWPKIRGKIVGSTPSEKPAKPFKHADILF